MIAIKKIFSRQYIFHTVVLISILIVFLFSFIFFLVNKNSNRRIFIFPSAEEGQYIVEYRNLAKESSQGDVGYFVDELLLGSTIERTKYIFTQGTKVLSCFQRENVLYINLSSDLLYMGEGVIDIKDGITLLKENIKKNFPSINKIEVFVDGKIAFEN